MIITPLGSDLPDHLSGDVPGCVFFPDMEFKARRSVFVRFSLSCPRFTGQIENARPAWGLGSSVVDSQSDRSQRVGPAMEVL